MITWSYVRMLPAVVGAAVLTGCALLPESGPSAPPPTRSGVRPAWSLTVPTGQSATVQTGNVLVIKNDEALLGVDPRNGRQRWRLPSGEDDTFTVAGDVIAHKTGGTVTMVGAADGEKLWKTTTDRLLVTQDAVFGNECAAKCTITRRDPRTGHVRWRVPSGTTDFGDTYVGVRSPLAPPTGRYLVTDFAPTADRWGARSTATGRRTRGHVPSQAWSELVAGRNLISTDHDPGPGDDRCTVRMIAADVVTGRHRWTRSVFSGRRADGECVKFLAPDASGLSMIGAGTRLTASTADGKPQQFDLRTGRTRWRATTPGVPIDGDAHGTLVRAQADKGPLRMLDATGRTRWTAPDPGLSGQSASWDSAVNARLVAVSGATGDRPFVLVYSATDGRLFGRFPGWLEGLGIGWVAIGHSTESDFKHLKYDFIKL